MNKIFTLVLSLIVLSNVAFSQRIDYDHTSKWFLGLNIGATWQTTDVRNQTNVGYGFTLGRSFNYDYAKAVSFDLRFRYLHGKWYGQDFDTTSLANYNPDNDYTSDDYPLMPYKDSLGFSVNNFETDNHRVALELAMHFNRLTERTGWDPYIFGGVGLSFTQTYGDLYNQNESEFGEIYDYSLLSNIDKTSLSTLMDGIYDTPLTGSSIVRNVQFMPSLGFGLGYQVGKRVTLGIEHKTTFTLRDDFDGFISSARPKNDLYHYTSAYVQFRFKVRGHDTLQVVEPIKCKDPLIYYRTPSSVSSTVGNQVYQLVADIYNVTSREEIRLAINGIETSNFTFNTSTHRLESTIVLQAGTNNIDILATNACGSMNSPVSIVYEPCNPPVVNLLNPTIAHTAVSSPAYDLSFQVSNMASSQGLVLTQNGQNVSNFSFTNNSVNARVTLNNGANTFVLTASNTCGTSSQTVVIDFQPCLAPVINFLSPSVNGTSVTSANFTVSASLQNVTSTQNIQLRHNGANISGFNFANGSISKAVTLVNGTNTFEVTATNNCGTISETITVNYQACTQPSITIVNPSQNYTTVASQFYTLLAAVQNAGVENVTISQNGQNLGLGTMQNGYVRKDVVLRSGNNSFVITASNSCGTVTQTLTIIYNDCTPPTIGLISPSSNTSSVSSAAYTFTAQVNNVATNGVTVTLNGNNFAVSNNNGLIRGNANLQGGVNTLIITATNACGTVTETVTINYNNCIAPSLSLINPANSNNVVVTNNVYSLTAQALNVDLNQISMTQNGQPVYGFTLTNGILKKDLSLAAGVNNIVITATNGCGNASQTASITFNNCVPPTLSWINPSNSNTITVSNASFNLSLQATNIASASSVTIFQNGATVTGATLNNGVIGKTLTLRPGENNVTIAVANECGSVTETVTIIYNDCVPPTISWIAPSNGDYITVTNANYQLTAQVNNSTQQMTNITQNGNLISGWSYNSGLVNANVTLVPGVNLFVITTSNPCGNSSKTVKITYNECIAPTLSWITPVNGNDVTVTSANYNLQAQISNASTQQMTVTLNGNVLTDAVINQGLLKYVLKLNSGSNTVVVSINTPCGTITETVVINYNDCVNPTITWVSPANGTNITVNEEAYQVGVLIGNASIQNVSATHNGNPITNASVDPNGVITANVKLVAGVNTFVVTVNNGCGTVTSTVTVTYVACTAPTITWINPFNGQATTALTAPYTLSLQVQDVVLQNVQVKQNGQPLSNVTLQNGLLQAQTTLSVGTNTFIVTVANNCGRISESVVVTYQAMGSGLNGTGMGNGVNGNVGKPKPGNTTGTTTEGTGNGDSINGGVGRPGQGGGQNSPTNNNGGDSENNSESDGGSKDTTKPTTTKPTTTKPTTTKPGTVTTKPVGRPTPTDTTTNNSGTSNGDSVPPIKPR